MYASTTYVQWKGNEMNIDWTFTICQAQTSKRNCVGFALNHYTTTCKISNPLPDLEMKKQWSKEEKKTTSFDFEKMMLYELYKKEP